MEPGQTGWRGSPEIPSGYGPGVAVMPLTGPAGLITALAGDALTPAPAIPPPRLGDGPNPGPFGSEGLVTDRSERHVRRPDGLLADAGARADRRDHTATALINTDVVHVAIGV